MRSMVEGHRPLLRIPPQSLPSSQPPQSSHPNQPESRARPSTSLRLVPLPVPGRIRASIRIGTGG
jgi:hypothetical protein